MNEEIKKRWVEALRSGKYRQGTGSLKKLSPARHPLREDNFEFCCLGVLTDLAVKDKVVTWDKQFSFLSKSTMDWAELKSCDPVINNVTLSQINDAGNSFNMIADLIEASL